MRLSLLRLLIVCLLAHVHSGSTGSEKRDEDDDVDKVFVASVRLNPSSFRGASLEGSLHRIATVESSEYVNEVISMTSDEEGADEAFVGGSGKAVPVLIAPFEARNIELRYAKSSKTLTELNAEMIMQTGIVDPVRGLRSIRLDLEGAGRYEELEVVPNPWVEDDTWIETVHYCCAESSTPTSVEQTVLYLSADGLAVGLNNTGQLTSVFASDSVREWNTLFSPEGGEDLNVVGEATVMRVQWMAAVYRGSSRFAVVDVQYVVLPSTASALRTSSQVLAALQSHPAAFVPISSSLYVAVEYEVTNSSKVNDRKELSLAIVEHMADALHGTNLSLPTVNGSVGCDVPARSLAQMILDEPEQPAMLPPSLLGTSETGGANGSNVDSQVRVSVAIALIVLGIVLLISSALCYSFSRMTEVRSSPKEDAPVYPSVHTRHSSRSVRPLVRRRKH